MSGTQAWPVHNCRRTQPFLSAQRALLWTTQPDTSGLQQKVFSRSRNGTWIHSLRLNSSCSISYPYCQHTFLSWSYWSAQEVMLAVRACPLYWSFPFFHSFYSFSDSLLPWPPSCFSLNFTAMWPPVVFQEYSLHCLHTLHSLVFLHSKLVTWASDKRLFSCHGYSN